MGVGLTWDQYFVRAAAESRNAAMLLIAGGKSPRGNGRLGDEAFLQQQYIGLNHIDASEQGECGE